MFHAELAGKGVEDCWAHAKAFYRHMPVSRKQGRENFKVLVKECTCSSMVLTKERIEKFASGSRAYICAYHHIVKQLLSLLQMRTLPSRPLLKNKNCFIQR
jgi:hypothetical protein